MNSIIKGCIYFILSINGTLLAQEKFFVSNNGSDSNEGTKKAPYQTINRAVNEIINNRNNGNKGEAIVYLRGGSYYFEKSVNISSDLSNITIAAFNHEQVVFHGGVSLPVDVVKDYRLSGNAKMIREIDLDKEGVSDLGNLRKVGFARPYGPSWAELFINKRPMELARWPNSGMIPLGEVIDGGAVPRQNDYNNRGGIFRYDSLRINKWKEEHDAWIAGYFMWGYADDMVGIKSIDTVHQTITTNSPTLYGFGDKKPWRQWYGVNILKELDEEGEYYIDRKNKRLYFISQNPVKNIEVSLLEEPFIHLQHAENVRIEGITFECSRGMGIAMDQTYRVTVANCVFRNLGSIGITVGQGIKPFEKYRHEGTGTPASGIVGSLQQHLYANPVFNRKSGSKNIITGCSFYQLGAGGVSLGGGDRLTLEEGHNVVENSVFYDINRIEKSYRPAVHLTGVGNQIRHCEMYNLPSMAILMHGNDHLIEYNYIHDVCLEVEDQGAVYYGRDPSERGNIIRYNFFRDIPDHYNTCAVYHDDGACGLQVFSNVFLNAGKWNALIGGGSDNVYINNIFIGSIYGIHIDNRLQNWSESLIEKNGLFEKRLKEVHYKKSPYKTAYPEIFEYFDTDPAVPKRNVFQQNNFINIQKDVIEGADAWIRFDSSNLIEEMDVFIKDRQGNDAGLNKKIKQLIKLKKIPLDSIRFLKY